MLKTLFHCTIVLAGLAAAAPQAARADDMPCLIRHTAKTAAWTVRKVSPAGKGKCKIYSTEPKYGDGNKILTEPVAELKDEDSSYTFDSGGVTSDGRDFWVVFYPNLGNVKVKLEFIRGTDTGSKASLLVDGLFAVDTWGKGPKITFSTSSSKAGKKAKCDKERFAKGKFIAVLNPDPQPFITLD
jgi:hypothetical protein